MSEHEPHVVPLAVYFAVFTALLVGTAVTVGQVADPRPIEIYPINYTLTPGGDTRQFLVRKLLARDPDDRYACATSLIKALEPVAALAEKRA